MVFEVVWTQKALDSYGKNIEYLRREWSEKEVINFIQTVQRKLDILSAHPYIGSSRNKRAYNLRFTILNKRVDLVYQVKPRKKQIDLILFWNTYRECKLNCVRSFIMC